MIRSWATLAVVALAATGCATPQVVRVTEFERGTLFQLERVTHDDAASEDIAGVCKEAVVYDTNKDGNWEVYMKSLTGRDVTRKTTSASADYAPSVTADCERIAFVSDREGADNIYVIAGKQASAALRVGEGDSPSFDPSGKAIYYQRFLPGENAVSIWRFDLTSNQHSQLVTGIHPAISPDGRQLAYAKFNEVTGHTALWVLDLETQQELQVASAQDRAVVLPSWSPDGKRLLITLNGGAVGARKPDEGTPAYARTDIAVVNRDGTGLTILTDNPVADIGRAWSGNYIYFTSARERSMDVWRFSPRFVDSFAPLPKTPEPVATPAAPPPEPPPALPDSGGPNQIHADAGDSVAPPPPPDEAEAPAEPASTEPAPTEP